MIDDNATAEDLLNAALGKLRTEEIALKREYDIRLDAVRRRIDAVRVALGEHGADTGAPASENESLRLPVILPPVSTTRPLEMRLPPTRWVRLLSGMSQTEALIRIAVENGGILRVTEAKKILIEAGKVRGQAKNVAGHIYHLINDSGRFEKVAPGMFRLVGPTSERAGQEDPGAPAPLGHVQNTGSISSS